MIFENMLRQDKTSENLSYGGESPETRFSGPTMENPDHKFGFSGTKLNFFKESGEGSRFSVMDRGGSQELTLSYLCENSKTVENEASGRDLCSFKGKNVVLESLVKEEKWVERDFLKMNDSGDVRPKREAKVEVEVEAEGEGDTIRGVGDCIKKVKLETQTLKLSLALPDVSLSLSESNATLPNPHRDVGHQLKPSRSVQSLAISNNCKTQGTCSNDFTAASLSYSYSLPFSHNPSCSLTRNSTEYYENSVGSRMRESDKIWNCGEGTNGSVHSRFKPVGDGVSLPNHGNGVVYSMLNRSRPLNRDTCNNLYRAAASDNSSFFPSELPAKSITDLCSVDTMAMSKQPLDHLKGFDSFLEVRGQKLSKGEKIVRDVIVEPIAVMSQLSRDLPVEAIESAREYLKYIMAASERKDEIAYLQTLLERRSDLTKETLSKSDGVQMEILVAVKFRLPEFVSGKLRLPTSELVEIFLYMRCRNVNCKSPLPVDDCDCKICQTKEGFCSQCMCPVCYNYDCANNTCSWVGCDACSHWCHAACGTEKKLIKPGTSLKGSSGSTEMQFYCLGCGHASEMFGFVKDVFVCCAKEWGLETLKKELDCVRRIFKGSEDLKGKELYLKAAELITRLERRAISPSDACSVIIHFFTSKPDKEDAAPKDSTGRQRCQPSDGFLSPSTNFPSSSSLYNSGAMLKGVSSYDNFRYNTPKPHISSDRHIEDELSRKFSKKDIFEFDSSDSIIRLKEEEARMFQNRADEARKEVEEYRQLVQAKTEKLEEEYSEKLAKLCLQDTEERRRRKLEELRIIESSHSDYFKMKIRMQAEISGLVERMEATKQLWV